jgi:hypothetical protein
MPDMLSDAAAWLDGMRSAHMSHFVSYTRGNTTQPCLATVTQSTFESQTDSGVVERWESRDFIVSYDELPFPTPHRGDKIVETMNGASVTYEVCAPRGAPVWQWADPHRNAVRIHTKAVGEV